MQFRPPDDKHMRSKHVEACHKLIVKQKFCASSWLITEIKNNQGVSLSGDIFIPYDRQNVYLIKSNHAMQCYICYWYVLVVI